MDHYKYSHFCTSIILNSDFYKLELKKLYRKLLNNLDSRYTANADSILLVIAKIYNECLNYQSTKNNNLIVQKINKLLKDLAVIDSGTYYFHVSNFVENGYFNI